MHTRLALALCLATAATSAAAADDNATCPGLLVRIETDGSTSAGSKNALRAAVMAGEPIRVGWALDANNDGRTDVVHWADAAFLTIFENDVFTQIAQIHRQVPQQGKSDIELTTEPSFWSSSLGTNGLWRGRFHVGQPVAFKVKSWWCRDPRIASPARSAG